VKVDRRWKKCCRMFAIFCHYYL